MLLAERGHEPAVLREVEVGGPELGHEGAEHALQPRLLQERQGDGVHREHGVERDLAHEARLLVLLDEGRPGAAGVEDEDRVRPRGAGLGQLGGEVELRVLAPLRHVLADHLAREGALDPGHHVLPGRVVGGHDVELLHALAVEDLAHRHRGLVVLPGGREEVLVAELAGELGRAGVRADEELAGVEDGFAGGEQDVRPDEPRHEIDVVGLDELVRLLLADLGPESVVLVEDLDVESGHLAADVLHREVDRILHVPADHAGPGGEGGHEADPDLVGPLGGRKGKGEKAGSEPEGDRRFVPHVVGLLSGRRPSGATVTSVQRMISERGGGGRRQRSAKRARYRSPGIARLPYQETISASMSAIGTSLPPGAARTRAACDGLNG